MSQQKTKRQIRAKKVRAWRKQNRPGYKFKREYFKDTLFILH